MDKIKIISSQRYLDDDVVAAKMDAMDGLSIVIDVVDICMIDSDGDRLYVLPDKHHTLSAAQRLGIEITYNITHDLDGLTSIDYLDSKYIDSQYYDINTGLDIDF